MIASNSSKNLLKYSEEESDYEPLEKRFKFSPRNCPLLKMFVEELWKTNEQKRLKANQSQQIVYNSTVPEVDINDIKNILPFLLKCNDDINYVNEHGQTILHVYLSNSESCYIKSSKVDSILAKIMVFKIVKFLLDKGAPVNVRDKFGRTPLHIAAMIKNKLGLIILMLDFFYDINACDNEGDTVLHAVVSFMPSVKILNGFRVIQFPCQIYQNCKIDDNVFFGIVSALLTRGADPNRRNWSGMTPLQYAIRQCNVTLLRTFKAYGGDFSVYTDNGDNLLNLVVHEDHCSVSCVMSESRIIETIDYLVNQGCDVNCKNKDGFSIIHFAANRNPAAKIIERLHELGADVNIQTKERKQTPLHLALMKYRFNLSTSRKIQQFKNIIRALTRAGADWYAIDYQGQTPLHYALKYCNDFSMRLWILSFGVNINDQNAKKIMRECHVAVHLKVALQLKTAGFPIDKEYELKIASSTDLCDHREQCLDELNLMIAHIISNGVSFYQFLHMNWQRQLALVNCLPENLEELFPIYYGTIWKACDKAVQRSRWIESAKVACCRITKINLPETCLERLFQFLSNWNLKVLIDASKTSNCHA